MLVICNGAFKSGSTWIYELVNSILKVKGISQKEVIEGYSPKRSPAMKIAESKLLDFVSNEDVKNHWFLTKAHFFREETLSARYNDHVRFLFVERDIRDAVVSHYHHFLVYNKIRLNFNQYYKLVGRYKAYEIWLFNERCRKYFGTYSFFRFEEMKQEVNTTIDRICDLLRLPVLNDTERQVVLEETSLDSLRKRAKAGDNTHYHGAGKENAKLFRKGITGEYKHYFSQKNLEDIERIIEGEFSPLSKMAYDIMFTYRRKIR